MEMALFVRRRTMVLPPARRSIGKTASGYDLTLHRSINSLFRRQRFDEQLGAIERGSLLSARCSGVSVLRSKKGTYSLLQTSSRRHTAKRMGGACAVCRCFSVGQAEERNAPHCSRAD